MNYSEVIKHFKSLQKRYTTEHNGKMCEKVQLALEALEKQIPKKPIEKFAFSDDIEAGLCPLCNEGVNEEMNFCSYCGQAIYWEGSE